MTASYYLVLLLYQSDLTLNNQTKSKEQLQVCCYQHKHLCTQAFYRSGCSLQWSIISRLNEKKTPACLIWIHCRTFNMAHVHFCYRRDPSWQWKLWLDFRYNRTPKSHFGQLKSPIKVICYRTGKNEPFQFLFVRIIQL